MSQAPQGKYDWAKNNYEKFLLLAALIILLASCAWLSIRINRQSDELDPVMARLNLAGDVLDEQDTKVFDDRLQQARDMAHFEFEPRANFFASERRVGCVKCGKPIPFNALKCPFCLGEQPEIVDIEKLDTDGDGIPDKMELELGLDPQNPMDAEGDLDGDGFTNVEEYLAQTDPRSGDSMPDPIVKLRVAAIKPIPFYLRFNGVNELAGNKVVFQLNLQSADRTYFAKQGDVVQGYSVTSYDPQGKGGPTLVLQRVSDGRVVRLVRGRPVTENELAIRFVFLIDRSALPPKRLNETFELRGKTYKVVDIQPHSVVIQEETTGKRTTVPQLSPSERAPAKPVAPPPAAAAAPSGPLAIEW
jgi:hypothetical protein